MFINVFSQKYYCFLFDTCFAITRPTRRFSKKYNLSFSVIPKDEISIQEDKTIMEIGFKIGEHFFVTEDAHKKRHWIDSFNKLQPRLSIPDKISNAHNKENLSCIELSESNYVARTSVSKRMSTSNINDNHFSFSIRKSLLKQKRNSIGYI